ncbi:MAG: hypothetical protein FRX49_09641 [Trebouxia sp. A1-2]|nr:MAG: hypothetical protein FRX49_09641 [Trebouxia sp. A1-2]
MSRLSFSPSVFRPGSVITRLAAVTTYLAWNTQDALAHKDTLAHKHQAINKAGEQSDQAIQSTCDSANAVSLVYYRRAGRAFPGLPSNLVPLEGLLHSFMPPSGLGCTHKDGDEQGAASTSHCTIAKQSWWFAKQQQQHTSSRSDHIPR